MSANSDHNQAEREPPRGGIADFWGQLPHRGVLLVLLAAWIVLFQFLGNSTLGYVSSVSIFRWWIWTMSGIHDQEHAYFMPLVFLGMLWWKQEELAALPKRIWWPAIALLLLAIGLHIGGYLVQQTRVSVVAFFLGIYALTGLVWGPSWMRASIFPFSLLLFAVPLGSGAEPFMNPITVPLRLWATKITGHFCHDFLGISNVRQMGNILESADGSYRYEVAAVCSGIKSLTTIVAFALIYGYVALPTLWRRLVLVGLAGPLAVLANVARLTMIIVASEAFGQGAGNYVHESEWISLVPYIPAFLGVLIAARFLRGGRKGEGGPKAPETVLLPGAEQKS